MAQVVADFEQKSDPDMVQAIPVRRRREMCGGPSGSLCFSDIGKRCSTSTIPWSPAVSSASDGSFLKSVYGEKDARADVQEANPSPNDLQEPAAGFQSQTHHSDEIASSEDGRMDASSYYESPEQMRASKTRSAVDSEIPTSSKASSLYGDRMDRAVKLMAALKCRLEDKPELLESVLAILYAVIGNQLEVLEARQKMECLLSDESSSDLLHEALLFLPIHIEKDLEVQADALQDGIDEFSDDGRDRDIDLDERVGGGGARHVPRKRLFSDVELGNLVKGVKRFGFGKWQKILHTYKFDSRTAVNLKDAYRVIERRRWKVTKSRLAEITPSRRGAFDPSPGSLPRRGAPR